MTEFCSAILPSSTPELSSSAMTAMLFLSNVEHTPTFPFYYITIAPPIYCFLGVVVITFQANSQTFLQYIGVGCVLRLPFHGDRVTCKT